MALSCNLGNLEVPIGTSGHIAHIHSRGWFLGVPTYRGLEGAIRRMGVFLSICGCNRHSSTCTVIQSTVLGPAVFALCGTVRWVFLPDGKGHFSGLT
jgi:hypothetical protein